MKLCPFCAEEIQDAAIKCKHCGEFLDSHRTSPQASSPHKWYFRTSYLVLIFACVGPFALPLIWWHPRLSTVWKAIWTLVILLLTWLLGVATIESIKLLQKSYQDAMDMLNM